MFDLLFIVLALAFFAVCAGLVYGFERLRRPS
jgi:hypothetical protein